jgi:hypothetical protein
MNTQKDFEELLRLFEENRVEYLIVGGYAVAFHGYPRFTKDIDLFCHNIPANIDRIRKALVSFGFTEEDLPTSLFAEKGNIIQFGISPLRVDIINEIDGVDFEEASKNAVRAHYGSVVVNFIGKKDLIINKKASGRSQDKIDADLLEGGKG